MNGIHELINHFIPIYDKGEKMMITFPKDSEDPYHFIQTPTKNFMMTSMLKRATKYLLDSHKNKENKQKFIHCIDSALNNQIIESK